VAALGSQMAGSCHAMQKWSEKDVCDVKRSKRGIPSSVKHILAYRLVPVDRFHS
jgi:hypothetical protein